MNQTITRRTFIAVAGLSAATLSLKSVIRSDAGQIPSDAVADKLRVTVLSDRLLPADFGFEQPHNGVCIHAEVIGRNQSTSILFNAGADIPTILRRMQNMRINPCQVNAVVVSHGDPVHTSGLMTLVERRNKMGLPLPTFFCDTSEHSKSLRESLSACGSLKHVGEPMEIGPGVYVTGDIKALSKLPGPSDQPSEQALVVDLRDKGLVVISCCASAGILNTIESARMVAMREKLHAVIGGFHLEKATHTEISQTIVRLLSFTPKYLTPP